MSHLRTLAIALTALANCVFAPPVAADTASSPGNEEQEIRTVIRDIESALKDHDRSRLGGLMASDFAILHSTGKLEGRSSFLDRAAAGLLMSQRVPAELLEETIRVYEGRTALRTTRVKALAHPSSSATVELSLRTIDVYAKVNGHWLWVSEQSTPIE